MDLSPAVSWDPPASWKRVTVIESHTGGEPFRVVVDGLPEIPGDTVLDRRRYAMNHLDDLRRALMWEPRGHFDMYGGWLGAPTRNDSDLSVLFLHNEGFSTMCGHGIIALTKVVLETGIKPTTPPETTLRIDTPAGQVVATALHSDHGVESVRFVNVPAFVDELDVETEVDGFGRVRHDVAFGGGFYSYVDAGSVGIDIADTAALTHAGRAIKEAVGAERVFTHPDGDDLGFLYGVIFTGEPTAPHLHSRHAAVFADGEIDRSPTGTAVSGRLAILHNRGEIEIDEALTIESISGSVFQGRVLDVVDVGGREAVVPEIEGSAHILGRSEFWFDPSDEQGQGFLLR